jgi:hypothetical protein
MIMKQTFELRSGEWLCAGCGAFMTQAEDVPTSVADYGGGRPPVQVESGFPKAVMEHKDGCPEVQGAGT